MVYPSSLQTSDGDGHGTDGGGIGADEQFKEKLTPRHCKLQIEMDRVQMVEKMVQMNS